MHTCSFSSTLAIFSCAAALTIAGCRSLPPSKPASEWTPEEARGAQVYQRNCARCHYPTTTAGLHGPGLQAITKVKAMASGAPPSDERLTAVIARGRGGLPASLQDGTEMRDLLEYFHSLGERKRARITAAKGRRMRLRRQRGGIG